MPDGSLIAAYVDDGNVDVLHDGQRLPGSHFDPHHQLAVAYLSLAAVAAIHLAVFWLPIREFLVESVPFPALVTGTAVLGTAYAALSLAIFRRSRAALFVALALTGLEAAFLTVLYLTLAPVFRTRVVLLLFVPCALLLPGIDALDQLEAAVCVNDFETVGGRHLVSAREAVLAVGT
jgi:hypothetical protein